MKATNIAIVATLSITLAYAADKPTSPELAAARTHYEAALTAATKPVRDKYILELEQLKNRAMTTKNLALAVEIDLELKSVGGVATPHPVPTPASTKLGELLPNSFWVPERANADTAYKSIEFSADGEIIFTPKNGTAEIRKEYHISDDGSYVIFPDRAGDGTLRFARDRRTFDFTYAKFKKSARK